MSNLITLCVDCHDLVELEGLKTLPDIADDFEEPEPIKYAQPIRRRREEHFIRPLWHPFVYGGRRHNDR